MDINIFNDDMSDKNAVRNDADPFASGIAEEASGRKIRPDGEINDTEVSDEEIRKEMEAREKAERQERTDVNYEGTAVIPEYSTGSPVPNLVPPVIPPVNGFDNDFGGPTPVFPQETEIAAPKEKSSAEADEQKKTTMKTENEAEISDYGQKNEKVRESAGEEYGKQSDKASENKYGKDKLNGFGDTVIHDGTYTAETSDSEEKKRSESGKDKQDVSGKKNGTASGEKKAGSIGTKESRKTADAYACNAKDVRTAGGSGNEKKEKGGMLILWLVVLGVAALLIGIGIGGGNSVANATATIKGASSLRVGETEVYTAQLSKEDIKFGDNDIIQWSVDGKVVKQGKATDQNAFSYSFAPQSAGSVEIGVKIGDYSNFRKTRKITVNKPLLTVLMEDKQITYGDVMPEYTYSVVGLREGDTLENLKLNIKSGVRNNAVNAGSYDIVNLEELKSDKYDIEVKYGKLSVMKRAVSFEDNTVYKIYDGTNICNDCAAQLNNVVEGDDLTLNGEIMFEGSDVGTYAADVSKLRLGGSAAENYTLDCEEGVKGVILKKELTLSELSAADKIYDGTANVTFNTVGKLNGVIDGDSVAVGSIKARFENSAVGNGKNVIIENITLVGEDAENYTVNLTGKVTADIKQAG